MNTRKTFDVDALLAFHQSTFGDLRMEGPTEAPPSNPPAETDPPAPEPPKPETDWKVEARKWEQRAKDNAKAAERLAKLEEAQKTDEQKRADAQAAAEKRAAEADIRALRLEVAFAKGLTPAQAKRLVGTTREEFEADADEIKRDFPVTPAKPKPDPTQGGSDKPALSQKEIGLAEARKRFGKPADK